MSKGAGERRRFKVADVAEADKRFVVRLDGKPLKTPAGAKMATPWRALAEAIAAEWRAQGERIALDTLPLTRIAATAIDRVGSTRAEIVAGLARYAETELLCHRAEAPSDLVARQAALWDPLLRWLDERYAARLIAVPGILAIVQPAASLARLKAALADFDEWRLAGLGAAASASGSLVIALALAESRLEAAGAFAAAELDASFQIERWGEDDEATQHRREVRADLDAVARYLACCR